MKFTHPHYAHCFHGGTQVDKDIQCYSKYTYSLGKIRKLNSLFLS